MRLRFRFVLLIALPVALSAQAQQMETLWNCKDKDGRITLTNIQSDTVGKDCRIVQQQRVSVVPAPAKSAPAPAGKAPAGFPREDASARASAKDRQRDILERELAQEQDLLGKARNELAAQESVRGGDEKNYARVLERLQKYKDTVEVHEKNVEPLRRELTNLNR
jgi:hypothetical protein